MYPYVLAPKLTTAIWGGDGLVERYGKSGDRQQKLGESWECWDENRVTNGTMAGRSLAELRAELGAALMGALDAHRSYPVLTKIIDAHAALSVQVHPDDAYAQRVEHEPNGKAECWYVLSAVPGAELVLGWTRDTDREEYARRVADGSLGDLLRRVPVHPGDVYYLPAGSLHAIGAGIVVFETQQTSDLTYRIFDWNRVGADGTPRALHIDKAADVLDFHGSHAGAIEPLSFVDAGWDRSLLIAAPQFSVERVRLRDSAAVRSGSEQSYALMTLESAVTLESSGGSVVLAPYETALIPASLGDVRVGSAAFGAEALIATPDPDIARLRHDAQTAGVTGDQCARFFPQFVPTP